MVLTLSMRVRIYVITEVWPSRWHHLLTHRPPALTTSFRLHKMLFEALLQALFVWHSCNLRPVNFNLDLPQLLARWKIYVEISSPFFEPCYFNQTERSHSVKLGCLLRKRGKDVLVKGARLGVLRPLNALQPFRKWYLTLSDCIIWIFRQSSGNIHR